MNRFFQQVWDWCWLTRPTVTSNIMLACACASVLSGRLILESESLLLLASIALLAGGGFVLNDVLDIEKDRISHPKRPLASGRVRAEKAAVVSITMLALAILLSLAVRNSVVSFQVLFGAFLVGAYSWIRNKVGWIGNIVTATLSLLPWGLPAGLTGQWSVVLEPAVGSFLLVLSREILLDIHDIRGDRKLGISTLPSIVGEKTSAQLSIVLMLLAFLGTIFIGFYRGYNPLFLIIVGFGVGIPGAVVTWILLTRKGGEWLKAAGHLGKIQFLSGIVAWWVSATFI